MTRHLLIDILLTLLLAAVGCAEDATSTSDIDDSAQRTAKLRLVSLSPALTRMLVDLGVGSMIVGRSAYCDAVDASVPVAGDLTNVDLETMVRLEPTHVFIQPPRSGIDPGLLALSDRRRWRMLTYRVNGIDDIRSAMTEISDALQEDLARPEGSRMADRLADWQTELDDVLHRERSQPLYDGKVLLLIPGDPSLVFGRQTYLGDVLLAFGVENACPTTGWTEASPEDLIRMDPDGLILIGENGIEAESRQMLDSLDLAAAREGRVAVLEHPDVMLPTSSVVACAREVRVILTTLADERR